MSVDALAAPAGGLSMSAQDRDHYEHAANRRMCAAAYIDAKFRHSVLRDVYNDRVRRVAPSYGFDVVMVVRHAWRAWWLEAAQNLCILAVLAIGLMRSPLATLIAVLVLAIWYVLRVMRNLARGYIDYYTGDEIQVDIWRVRARAKMLRRLLIGLSAALIVTVGTAIVRSGQPGRPRESWLSRTGLAGAAQVVIFFAAIVALVAAVRFIWLGQLRTVNGCGGTPRGRRMCAIDKQQRHPFTVHSTFRPFIGSGPRLQGWSFAQRLSPRSLISGETIRDYDKLPFTAESLVQHLKVKITNLRDDVHAETRLPGLAVEDHVFVEGTLAAPYHRVLLSEKNSEELESAIAEAIANPSDPARHYLACRVISWGGEIVTTVFVHVSLQGRMLYLEFSTHALLPTKPEYHVVDEYGGTGVQAILREITKNLINLPRQLAEVWRITGLPLQAWASLKSRKDRAVARSLRLDIGAAVSLREAAAMETDRSYFQYQDVLQHSKIIERRLIATVGEYLQGLGVDTSEFWERATTILNNGIIATGANAVISSNNFGEQVNIKPSAGGTGNSAGQAGGEPA